MAKKTRPELYAKILANLPDNTTEAITPATDRDVENAEVESCFNLLDDDATDVNYNPTTSADWLPEGAPTEVGEMGDILAARTGVNLSQDIAYVSNVTTAGITPELGNPLKPYSSFATALNALPSSNCIVKALGGTYTEDIVLNSGTVKSKCALILEGVTINGRISISTTNSDISVFLNGSTITNSTSVATISISASGNNFIYGGTVINNNANEKCLEGSGSGIKNVIGTKFESQKNCTNGCFTFNFVKCNFNSQSVCVFRTNNSEFYGCNIVSATSIGFFSSTTSCKLYNCFIEGGNNGIQGENNLIGYFNNCRIEGTNGKAASIGTNSNELFLKDCDLIGSNDCIEYLSNTTRAATTNHIFQNCKMYAGTGNIFNEPTYGVSDLGNTQVINCTYNKSFTPATGPQKIFEYNKVEITGLQEPLK